MEIEIKARIERQEDVVQKLRSLGAKYIKTEKQEDVYFNHPSRDFSTTDEALRIRSAGGIFSLTYKGPKIDKITKTREEYETEVSDIDETEKILEKLGFKKAGSVVKTRVCYRLGVFSVMLDSVEGLGDFVEIEKESGFYKEEELIKLLAKLGIDERAVERRSYLELLKSR
ncbi:MAG: class IV adenylate cyclase [Candidatus Hydrothermarchaeaceae archaeon]